LGTEDKSQSGYRTIPLHFGLRICNTPKFHNALEGY
jgi:hypothetical protein